jgi:hypothetical protein
MATTTPNYAWVVPTSSDLVKNGATAIETLGDSVDASLWDSGFGQAGKNKVINGNFAVNQRAFTTSTSTGEFNFDRWLNQTVDGTTTFSAQTFTPGAAPVAGYESTNFIRLVSTGQTLTTAQSRITQRLEDVRTFAGQTVTVSFWAKASTGTPSVAVNLSQNFGSGGSATVNVNGQKTAITASWVRYYKTFAVPSVSGKTIGTSSYVNLNIWTSAGSSANTSTDTLGIQSVTIDFWGFQVEAGSYATPFQTASGGSIQGELAMCQRYYLKIDSLSTSVSLATGFANSTTVARGVLSFPVTMRIRPTALEQTGTATDYEISRQGSVNVACSAVPTYLSASANTAGLSFTVASGLTAGEGLLLRFATFSSYVAWSAEL